ncbi:hypothetical protein N7462_007750 [Penicillium macrosclerotiorum]|uniref:uncharacterized protein n=1 Tax=Penicillium macrosclerotiorum TaxID=303699 RepID=UPI002546B59D|nr:uncharacterized protein N7462_007750 [Penicillium macrosclerotiorum]KAJ5679506.1 hypothetical protein N7462_007750 [Penicillium macrosclerotiorum]
MATGRSSLKGQAAIVTGGGSGINLAFSQLLVEFGCNVLIADLGLRPEAHEWIKATENSGNANLGRPFFLKTDVTDWSQLERTFTECIARFGQSPTIVVPGAGIFDLSTKSFWDDCDTDSRYKVLDVNLTHPIKMTRLAIRHMLDAKNNTGHAGVYGTIIHVSSITAQLASMITPLYAASKHGISSFVRSMAPLQEAAGIRVVGVAPGTVATPLMTEHAATASLLNLKRDFLLPPEELARAMMALVLDIKRYKAGTILEVCDIEGRWREVSLLNDPGPQGPASNITGSKRAVVNDIWKILGLRTGAKI